jgi:Uncharacterized conserved protein (DUF2249)
MNMPPISQFKRFDVRPMLASGDEPFPAIYARAQALKPGAGLIIIAPFLPSPLIERLGSEGFVSKLERGTGAEWLVYLWRENE